MTPRPRLWTVLADHSPWRAPNDADVLGAIESPDRDSARHAAERIYPGRAVVVVAAAAWPLVPDEAGGKSIHSTAVEKRRPHARR